MLRTENTQVCKCFFIPCFMWQITRCSFQRSCLQSWYLVYENPVGWFVMKAALSAVGSIPDWASRVCTLYLQHSTQSSTPLTLHRVSCHHLGHWGKLGVSLEITVKIETEVGDWIGKPSEPGMKRRNVRKNVTSGNLLVKEELIGFSCIFEQAGGKLGTTWPKSNCAKGTSNNLCV